MKYFFIIGIMLYASTLFSCSDSKKKIEDEKCLPAIVLIGYLGEDNKPTYPLVIRTNENDTSFLEFIGFENEKFKKTGFLTSKEYYRISTLKPEVYQLLKSYIAIHNTHKVRTVFNADGNTMKIILYDKCDSIAYAVNKEDKGYFSKMVDTLKLKKEDDGLWRNINYYDEIQKRNSTK